ncbi:chromate efflux transporter [Photobacterium atrarenae]|uniref:Chromate efflux transporter n=1 Tax=Photobacterium atrarenae TaxID=865757 RepID=A0ABY5GP18_9GAMM|nr:chromate efflux transporter [Photobacterium atrarenae]UTV30043.1 chromate efflux transporter [Photobacterium atrarenae]
MYLQVLYRFFILGLYSFGGPAAHIGYFQREFVLQRKWLSDQDFTQAVALCQFLPGPASSQLGMYIGYSKAGYLGALAAFLGFTFPSFMLLTGLAIGAHQFADNTVIDSVIHAAKLLAVVVVADALWGMAKKNLTNVITVVTAVATAASVYFSTGLLGQIVPILCAALLGYVISFSRGSDAAAVNRQSKIRPNVFLLSVFTLLLFGLPLIAAMSPWAYLFNTFFQAGSFVFGGGHVVLPLLEPLVHGMVTQETFLSAYASAQLVPGPMFTMASYLGSAMMADSPVLGSAVATLAIFLPGGLLLFAFLPAWHALMVHPKLKLSLTLVNACVVGLLASAFVSPVIETSITSAFDLVAVFIGYALLKYRQCPVWILILAFCGYSIAI